ncbi:hypothetical protein [Sphingomonas sp. OK281]|uniref:hypothetical protein n=1 Tax=Sphingomonas sp. OK281 TaxID=1881067 RepID=UPI00111449D4|nr:hypothetical protein [Sphingomonas sp. OK281]
MALAYRSCLALSGVYQTPPFIADRPDSHFSIDSENADLFSPAVPFATAGMTSFARFKSRGATGPYLGALSTFDSGRKRNNQRAKDGSQQGKCQPDCHDYYKKTNIRLMMRSHIRVFEEIIRI